MSDGVALFLTGSFWSVLLVILAARVSHWAHETQRRLEVTNRLLYEILTRNGGPPLLPDGRPMPVPT